MGVIGAWAALLLAGQAAEPVALAPAGKWTLEYGNKECTLARSFGSSSGVVTFALRTGLEKRFGELMLVLRAPIPAGPNEGSGRVLLSPSGRAFDAQWLRVPLRNSSARSVSVSVDSSFWGAFHQADSITFEIGEAAPVALRTGSIAKAAVALDSCRGDQLRSLGADPDAVVDPDPEQIVRLFGPGTYPREAIMAGAQGRAVVLLTVDRSGAPTACRPLVSASHQSLDSVTCGNLMRGARFATVADSGPVKRWSVVSVRWQLPR